MTKQYVQAQPKIGRNDPCPCESGKKYKYCCLKVKRRAVSELRTRMLAKWDGLTRRLPLRKDEAALAAKARRLRAAAASSQDREAILNLMALARPLPEEEGGDTQDGTPNTG